MRAWNIFVTTFVCLSVLQGCASPPTFVRMISLERDPSFVEGTLLLAAENLSSKTLWQILDLKTGNLRPYNMLNNIDAQFLLSPSRASDVRISQDGKNLAFETYLQEEGYIISSQDGVSTYFAPLEKFNPVYLPTHQEWFIVEADARNPQPLAYPLTPTGMEEKISYSLIQSKPTQIATQWDARLGTKEISTLVVISSDGKGFIYFPDWHNEWQELQGWLNENDLQLTTYATANFLSPYTNQTLGSDQTVLLNWQTGEKLVSGDNLPDKYFLTWAPVYSPSKNYVTYLGQQGKHLLVFDRAKNKVVLEISLQGTVPVAPLWIDDTYIIGVIRDEITEKDHLFILGKDGNLQQINLNLVEHPSISSLLLPQLSYDQKLMSFWLIDQSEPEKGRLLFLDIQRSQIYDFSLPFADLTDPSKVGQGWLPSQPLFAFSTQQANKTEITIVDAFNGKMFNTVIPLNAVLAGAITVP